MVRQRAEAVKSLFYFQLRSGLLFLLVTLLAIGGGIYHFSQQVLVRTVESNLQTHADFLKGRILAFVAAQKHWMQSVSTSPEIIEHADQLRRLYREQGAESESFQRQSRHFYQEHEGMARAGGIDQLFLLSPQGELLFTLNSGQGDIGADFTSEGMYGETIFSEVLEQVLQHPQLTISSYGYLEFLEEQTVLMATPLFSRSAEGRQQVIAILVRPLMLDWLRAMLSEYSGLGRTGDVVIAQKDLSSDVVQVNFINILRGTAERTEACAALQRAEPEHFPMLRLASARSGFDGVFSGSGWVMDPRCQEVFSVWSWIAEPNWGMVVKQDRAEVLEPVRSLQQDIAVALILATLFLVWLAQRQARVLSQPIEELTEAAQRDRVDAYPPGRVLEINLLAEAMQGLVQSLHRNEAQLEEKVESRTRELTAEKDFVELILNSMQEGMLVLSDEGEVLQANQMMYQLVGRGYAFALDEVFEVEREEGGSARGMILSRSGERIPVQVSQLQLGAAQVGMLSRGATLMLFFDLRERIRMEEQEQYLAFQSGVAEMSATLLHNVGNAITGINGYISLLEDRGRQLVDVERSLRALGQKAANGEITLERCAQGFELVARVIDSEGLNSTTRQMSGGVERISTILRAHRAFDQQEQVITTFSGCTMVEDAAELVRDDCAATGVELTLQCEQQLYLTLPRNPLIQMILNLLKQGIESVRRRKRLEPGLSGTLTLQMSGAGENRVRLVVSDNGIGITGQQRSALFVASAAEGGQRLHTVANFVNSIGGEIRAESGGEMQGTRFIVLLPQRR